MRKSDIIVGLDSLRYDLEMNHEGFQSMRKRDAQYYDEVIAEALVILIDIDE